MKKIQLFVLVFACCLSPVFHSQARIIKAASPVEQIQQDSDDDCEPDPDPEEEA